MAIDMELPEVSEGNILGGTGYDGTVANDWENGESYANRKILRRDESGTVGESDDALIKKYQSTREDLRAQAIITYVKSLNLVYIVGEDSVRLEGCAPGEKYQLPRIWSL